MAPEKSRRDASPWSPSFGDPLELLWRWLRVEGERGLNRELKSEIAAKLDAKGVKNYTLNIVAAEEVKDQKVVGSCDGGTKRIVYSRN